MQENGGAFGDGDWKGIEELREPLQRYLLGRCRDASEVDDVVQETLLRVARYRDRLAEPSKLRPWARRIAVNVLCDRVRRESRIDRVPGGEAVLHAIPARESEPAAARTDAEGDEDDVRCGSWLVEKERALAIVSRELRGLRREDRELLSSFYGGRGSCRETARSCRVPADLVKVRLFRARSRLRRAVRRRLAMTGGERHRLGA